MGPARQFSLPVRSSALTGPWAPPVGLIPPELPVHAPRIAVDSVPTTHAEATPVPTPAFSSCLVPHSLSSLTRALAAPQHSPHTMCTPRELRLHSSWSPLSHHRVCCLGELHPVTRDLGHPLIRSLPLCFSRSTLTGPFSAPPQLGRRRPVTSSCPDRCLRVLKPSLKVTNLTPPLISPCLPSVMHDYSLE